jgi:hypothetical protein
MDEVVSAVEAPVTAPPPPAPDLHSEIREVRELVEGLHRDSGPHIPALEDADAGRQKPVYSGAHDSARYLARRRREAAQADPSSAPPEPSGVDLEIGYVDGRESVDAKTAARDLADYRQRMAQQLLEGVDPTTAAVRASGQQQEAPAEQPVEQQPQAEQPRPSERTHYTKAEVEAAAVAQLQDYQDRVGAILLSIRGVGVPPELMAATQNPQAWAALQSTDPQKAAQLIDYVNRRSQLAAQLETDLNQARAQQEQIQRTQFSRWAEQQDSLFEQAEPEMRGENSAHLQRQALETLMSYGLGQEEIANFWNGAPISMRSAVAQRLILDASRWRTASQKAKQAIARPSPPPQRPSVRQDRVSASAADLQAMSRQLDAAGSAQQQLRLAGRLVAERRRAAQG